MLRISAGAGTGWRLIIDQFPRPANHHSASRELGNGNDPVPLTARGPCLAAWAAAGMLPLLLLVPRTPGRAYPQMRRTRVADRPAAATTAPAAQIAGRSPSGLHDGPPCSVETASRSRYGNVDRPPDGSAPPDARDRAPTHKPDLLLRRHTLSKPVVADQVWRGKRAGDCEHAAGSSSCPRPRRSPAPFAQARDALDDSNGEVVAIATRRIEDVPTSTKTPIGRSSVAGWRRTNQQRRTELWSVAAP